MLLKLPDLLACMVQLCPLEVSAGGSLSLLCYCCFLQGTNAHMVLSPTGSSQHVQQAGAAVPAWQWRRSRFWTGPAGHPLLQSYLHPASAGTGTVLLQADLGSAAATFLRQHSTNSPCLLPATSLLELVSGGGALLCEDAVATLPAVLGAAVTSQLALTSKQALLLTCSVELQTGAAEVLHSGAAAMQQIRLLSCILGVIAGASLPASPLRASASAVTASALLLMTSGFNTIDAPRCTAELAPSRNSAPDGLLLPPALCEAACTLGFASSPASGPQAVRACAVFVVLPRREQPTVTWGNTAIPPLLLACCSQSADTPTLQLTAASNSGGRALELSGLLLACAGPTPSPSRSDSYDISWKRVAAGEADPQ